MSLRRPRVLHSLLVVLAAALPLVACAPAAPVPADGADVVRVPEDAPTISDAVEAVAEGGLVLVAPGVYEEQVQVSTPGVTVRGLDRNETVIDGQGTRPFGIVAIADGVTVENLTVTGATFYGVLVTGMHDENGPTAHGGGGYSRLDPEAFPPVQGFAIDHVTAYNNGLYGLYAFDAQNGVIRDSYASGSADSGIYVGQCRECNILVEGNVAENNAVGFENANASDAVWVVGNRFSRNRVGMTFLSNYQEAFVPQRSNNVVGNAIVANAEPESPSHAEGAFGVGVGISGGTKNTFERNLIADHPRAGVVLENTEDLPATANVFRDGAFDGNAVDIANLSSERAAAAENCAADEGLVTLPEALMDGCPGPASQPAVSGDALPPVEVPVGMSFLDVPAPPAQPDIADPDAPARVLPRIIEVPDLSSIALPGRDLLQDRVR